MPVYETYSRRQREARGAAPDVYTYDAIPKPLRTQVRQILSAAIGRWHDFSGYEMSHVSNNNEAWKFIHNAIAREMGVDHLAIGDNPKARCMNFIAAEQDVDQWLTLVEFALRYIDRTMRAFGAYDQEYRGIQQGVQETIDEMNFRFLQAAVGYQYVGGQIIRVDSQLVHHEVVVPALRLLTDPRFAGAQEEFLAAHAHYRAGDYKECAPAALNALESTMKAICDARSWKYEKGARASDLLKIIRASGLLPDYLDQSFDQLIATLKSGLPQVRNEEGGHGQGAKPKATPAYVAAYALHLAAAKIVLLCEALLALETKE